MTIIQATLTDIKTIQQVGTQSYYESFLDLWTKDGIKNFIEKAYSLPKLRSDLKDKEIYWFLCLDNMGNCIGIAKIILNAIDESKAVLEKIYFLEEVKGKGHAQELIQFLITFLKSEKQISLTLEVLQNNVLAISFYKKQDFVIEEVKPYSTDRCEIGMHTMIRQL